MCSICATLLCWKNFTPAKLRMVGVVDRQEPIHFLQEPRGGMWRCSCNHCPNRMGRVQNLWLQVAWKGNRLLGLFMEAKGTKNPPKETHTWTEIDWGCSTTWLEMFGDALVSLYTILYTACTCMCMFWNLAVAAHLCRFKFRAPKICWLTTDEEFVGFGCPQWLNMSETSLHWHEWHADVEFLKFSQTIAWGEWRAHSSIRPRSFYDKMMKPAFLFDGRNMLDHAALVNIGFEVHALGKGQISTEGGGSTSPPDFVMRAGSGVFSGYNSWGNPEMEPS